MTVQLRWDVKSSLMRCGGSRLRTMDRFPLPPLCHTSIHDTLTQPSSTHPSLAPPNRIPPTYPLDYPNHWRRQDIRSTPLRRSVGCSGGKKIASRKEQQKRETCSGTTRRSHPSNKNKESRGRVTPPYESLKSEWLGPDLMLVKALVCSLDRLAGKSVLSSRIWMWALEELASRTTASLMGLVVGRSK